MNHSTQLHSLVLLLEARDEFFVQNFGQKLIDKLADENSRMLPIPNTLTTSLQTQDNVPPAKKIVDWFIANDPIEGKGAQWMIVQYIRGNYQLEDIDDIKHTLREFVRVRSQLEVKDIGQYKTVQLLKDALEPFQDTKVVSNRQARKSTELDPAIKDEIEILVDTNDLLIAIPKTHKASRYLASRECMGALSDFRICDWCTARETNQYYRSYTSQGPLYIIFIKEGPDRGKYQFHFPTEQFMISANSPIPDFRAWLERNKPIRDFFAKEAAEYSITAFLSSEEIAQILNQKIQSGEIEQPLLTDKIRVLYVPNNYRAIVPLIPNMRQTFRTNSAPPGRHTEGIWYFTLLPSNKSFAYKLGSTNVYFNDNTPYPLKSLTQRYPDLKELLIQELRNVGVDITDQTTPIIQTLIASGDAKQIMTSDEATVWWIKDFKQFQRYLQGNAEMYTNYYFSGPPSITMDAGVMVIDTGSQLEAYRLGDTYCFSLDDDPSTSWYSVVRTPIAKFMVEHPQIAPIIKKYADHYKYFPLMSDKGRQEYIQTLANDGKITIIKKDSPSVIQLQDPSCAELLGPLLVPPQSNTAEQRSSILAGELQKGPVFLIQGNILFSPGLGATIQVNSNSYQVRINTQQVFTRFPVLRTLLKDQLIATGTCFPNSDIPDDKMISGLTSGGHISQLSHTPLAFELKTPLGIRWFVNRYATPDPSSPNAINWDKTGIKPMHLVPNIRSSLIKTFGFFNKQKKVNILYAFKNDDKTDMCLHTNPRACNEIPKNTVKNIQGILSILSKQPGLMPVIAAALGDLPSVPGLISNDAANTTPFDKTSLAITDIMKALKYGNSSTAQNLSETNIDKFEKGCYNVVAYLKEYAGQFTDEQAISTAERITNVMKFVSANSMRTMPTQLAEWIKYAPQLSNGTIEKIIAKNRAFIAGIQPVPLDLMTQLYNKYVEDRIVIRQFGKMTPEDERTFDRNLMEKRESCIGVNYNNVVDFIDRLYDDYPSSVVRKKYLQFMKNVPSSAILERRFINGNNLRAYCDFEYPSASVVKALCDAHGTAWLHLHRQQRGIQFDRRDAHLRALTRYLIKNHTTTGFTYNPQPVVIPTISRPATRVAAREPVANRPPVAPRVGNVGNNGGFATKAAHARHIIDNRGPDDTRTSLIRRLIDEVGLTPAGASTYYYNLTRPNVREGDELLGLLHLVLLDL